MAAVPQISLSSALFKHSKTHYRKRHLLVNVANLTLSALICKEFDRLQNLIAL